MPTHLITCRDQVPKQARSAAQRVSTPPHLSSPPAAGDLLPEALGLVRHAAVLLLAGLDHDPPVLLELRGRHAPQGARKVSQEGLDPVVQVLGPMQACNAC